MSSKILSGFKIIIFDNFASASGQNACYDITSPKCTFPLRRLSVFHHHASLFSRESALCLQKLSVDSKIIIFDTFASASGQNA